MPQRKSVVKHITTAAQGDDSWVIMQRPTVGQMKLAQRAVAASAKLSQDEKDAQSFEVGMQVIKDCVLEWNWVDGNGKPLDQVPANPDVVDELTDQEVIVLMKLFNPDEEEAKNSVPAS